MAGLENSPEDLGEVIRWLPQPHRFLQEIVSWLRSWNLGWGWEDGFG